MSPSSGRTGRVVAAQVLLLGLGSSCGVGLGEGGLRLVEAHARPWGRPSEMVDDPRLGKRLAPHAAGCDARGYRNPVALQAADVLAIGDSQTWGVNARVMEAWPGRLQALTGRSVYNMSGGGFGMAQYAALFAEGLALRPRLVILGLYLGNDLYDAYKAVYSMAAWKHLRLEDHELALDTVGPRADAEWHAEKAFHLAYGKSDPRTWGLWLRGHTAIGRLVERAGLWPGNDAWFEIGRAWALAHPASGSYYNDGIVRTVFTVGYRSQAVDLDEVRIREGLRLTSELLAGVDAASEAAGVNLLILLIPTKERVFEESLRAVSALTEAHARLARREDSCRAALLALTERLDLPTLDLLKPLEAAVAEGRQVYPTNIESHPSPAGYDLIARTIASHLHGAGSQHAARR